MRLVGFFLFVADAAALVRSVPSTSVHGGVAPITKLTAQDVATGTAAVGQLPGRGTELDVDAVESPFTLRIETFGADPSGVLPADDAFSRAIEFAWSTGIRANHTFYAHIPDLGGLQFDLAGGTFLLDAPVVFPSASGGANFGMKDGTLRASKKFPAGRYLVEVNVTAAQWPKQTFESVSFRNILFDGAGHASGLACVYCNHITVEGCWFYRFLVNGFLAYDGHANYVSNSWFSQCGFNDNATPLTANGTGVSLQSSDSSIVDSVIFCTKLGILVTAGNSVIQDVSRAHTCRHARQPILLFTRHQAQTATLRSNFL
eukprot:COSAG02_NODE_8690_length_2478_cov_2.378731_1_plen_316_part_00